MTQNDPPPIVTGDWNVEGQESDGKSGIPKWLMGCGCGCLVLLLLGAGGLFMGTRWASSNFGPEEQWAELDRLLPYEEQPENLEPVVATGMGFVNWIMSLTDTGMSMVTMMDTEAGLTIFLMGQNTGGQADRDADADPDVESGDLELEEIFSPSDSDAGKGVARGFVEIQGRKVPWMYGQHNSDQPWMQGFSGNQNVQTFVDLTEGDRLLLMVVGRLPGRSDEDGPQGRITDAELQALLAPFKVWERP